MTNWCNFCPAEGGCNDERHSCPVDHQITVSITDRCTRECIHCFQEAGVRGSNHMSMETAAKVATLESEAILLIYGGEIVCHPQWEQILTTMLQSPRRGYAVHTNGDWVKNPTLAERLLTVLAQAEGVVCVVLSSDGYHDLATARRAFAWLREATGSSGPRNVKIHGNTKLRDKVKLYNDVDADGGLMTASHNEYELLPLGRARHLPCERTRTQRSASCPLSATDAKGTINPFITPDGSVFSYVCGAHRLGTVDTPMAELASNYQNWRRGKKPATCGECLAASTASAWRK